MKRERPRWAMLLLDRLLYALASAVVALLVGLLQGYAERQQLRKDVKNLEWGIDYFRK